MRTRYLFLFVCLSCGITLTSYAQTEEQILTAWEQNDYVRLLTYHSTADSSLVPLLEDAIALVQPSLDKLNYDQLEALRKQCSNDSLVINLLTPAYNNSKRQIIAKLYTLNSGEMNTYLQEHPSHREVLISTFENCILESLPSIPLPELLMIEDAFPNMQTQVANETNKRKDEMNDIVKSNIMNYTQNEAISLYRLQYVISRKTHAYLYARYGNVCYQYAAEDKIPDDLVELEKQFMQIVKQNLSSDDLRQYLQLEVDAYCLSINKSRSQLSKSMGLKQFYPLQITIPQMKIGYKSDKTILERIPRAKENYADNRETIDDVAEVAGWFMGGIGGWLLKRGGKALAERWAGSRLADKITYARLAYIESCYQSLLRNFEKQIESVNQNINEQLINNEQQFIDYVKTK